MRNRLLLLLVLLAPLATPFLPAHAQSTTGTLPFDGLERTYHLHLPEGYSADHPVPLVIALHDFASSGQALASLSNLDAVADAENFIVAYPNSADLAWNDGRESTVYALTDLTATDDPGYIMALRDHLLTTYAVDPAQIHLIGQAHGTGLVFRLACDFPQAFASAAAIGGTQWNYAADGCQPTENTISMLVATGDVSPYYPPEGRVIEAQEPSTPDRRAFSLAETASFWAERNNCPADAPHADSALHVITGCEQDTTVTTYAIPNTGAEWPDALITAWGGMISGDEEWTSGLPSTAAEPTDHRSYRLYVPPSYDPAFPTPLVIALHGRPDTGAGFAYLLDMNHVASENNFIVVYPDGIDHEWNYVRGYRGFPNSGVDDVQFLAALVEELSQMLTIDSNRVYIVGFSNGGFMTQRVACEAPDDYAAFASVGATLFPGFITLCADSTPRPILLMHGTRDRSIPWEGIQQNDITLALPALDTVAFWIEHNSCTAEIAERYEFPVQNDAPNTFARRYRFDGCPPGGDVLFYAIEGGGHNLPGVDGRLDPQIAGATNMDMNAAEEIWAFFAAQERPTEE